MIYETRIKGLKIVEYISPTPEELASAHRRFSIKNRELKDIFKPGSLAQFEASFAGKARYSSLLLVYPHKGKKYIVFRSMLVFFGRGFVVILRQEDKTGFSIVQKAITRFVPEKIDALSFLAVLVKVVSESYLEITRSFSTQIARLEKRLKSLPPLYAVEELSRIKRNLVFSNTAVKSLKQSTAELLSSFSSRLNKKEIEQWEQVIDTFSFVLEKLEDYESIVDTLFKISESRLSTIMNNSIKILTVIQSLFLPATLLASIYGMNVKLPLATNPSAFWWLSGVMLFSTLCLLWIIRKL